MSNNFSGRRNRLEGLNRLEVARTGPVRHIATAVILPPTTEMRAQLPSFTREPNNDLNRKKELAAEDITIASLIAEGFPADQKIQRLGHMKYGFDIRAHRLIDSNTGQIDVRRFKAKGYTEGNPIQLTINEWYKAQQLGKQLLAVCCLNPQQPSVSTHSKSSCLPGACKEGNCRNQIN